MGRAMLIVVILMCSIYAGIMTTMQRNILSLPNIISRNMINKQAESVSDYALRTAVRNSIAYGLMAGESSLIQWKEIYNNFNIQNCKIDSIDYTFVSGTTNSYRAISYVTGNLMGRIIKYRAEIAFSFPLIALLNLDYCIYLQMNQPAFNPSEQWGVVIDTSDNDNNADFFGNMDTAPHGTGVDGWKAASFGEKNFGQASVCTNPLCRLAGSPHTICGYIVHTGNASMVVASNFTIMTFAKINQGRTAATLIWLPTDPTDPEVPGNGIGPESIRKSATGAIYYANGNMYFTATTYQGATAVPITVSTPFVPDGKQPHNKDPWYFFALTYNQGQVKGYVNGLPIGTNSITGYATGTRRSAIRNQGLYLGRELYRNFAIGDIYHYMYGLMDQVGLVPRTLTDAEINLYYNQTINPATIQYIRD